VTDDPVAETIERLSRGSAEALLDPGATDLVARLRAAAFRESGGGLGVGVREAHTLLALGWARFVLLRGADRPEAGDELHDVVEAAFLVAGARFDGAATVLTDLLARLPYGDRWEVLNDVVVDLFALWRHRGARLVLGVAVALARRLVDRVPSDDPNAEIVHSNIGGLLAAAAAAIDDGPLLDEAIAVLVRDGTDGNSTRLATLADALLKRHDRTRQDADVAAALDRARAAVAAIPSDDPDPAFPHMVLGLALLAGEKHDEAVAELRWAVTATPHDHPESAARWSNLGLAYSERHALRGGRQDLDDALDAPNVGAALAGG